MVLKYTNAADLIQVEIILYIDVTVSFMNADTTVQE